MWRLHLEKAARADEGLAEKCMMGASLAQRDGGEPVAVLLVLESLFLHILELGEAPHFFPDGVSG